MQMQDVGHHHTQLRNRVSVVGIPGTYTQVTITTTATVPLLKVRMCFKVINEESVNSDKPGPYKTTTTITNRFKQTTRNVQI